MVILITAVSLKQSGHFPRQDMFTQKTQWIFSFLNQSLQTLEMAEEQIPSRSGVSSPTAVPFSKSPFPILRLSLTLKLELHAQCTEFAD